MRARETATGVLLADIGGTNARFAVLEAGRLTPVRCVTARDFANFRDALSHVLGAIGHARALSSAILAVAGPVEPQRCVVTNSGWVIDAVELRAEFGFSDVRFLNDFQAIAWALPRLNSADLVAIGRGKAVSGQPLAVLGPGTGLGLACLVNGPSGEMAIGTEGGHTTLPSSSAREDAVITHLRKRFGHVSAERALSGHGLENLYDAIRSIDGAAAPDRSAAEITQAANEKTCAVSAAALNMFCDMLGTVAGNVALTFAARGGVFVSGGIVPRIVDFLGRSQFRARFEAKGRFRDYLGEIPTSVIIRADPAFVGLKLLAQRYHGVTSA